MLNTPENRGTHPTKCKNTFDQTWTKHQNTNSGQMRFWPNAATTVASSQLALWLDRLDPFPSCFHTCTVFSLSPLSAAYHATEAVAWTTVEKVERLIVTSSHSGSCLPRIVAKTSLLASLNLEWPSSSCAVHHGAVLSKSTVAPILLSCSASLSLALLCIIVRHGFVWQASVGSPLPHPFISHMHIPSVCKGNLSLCVAANVPFIVGQSFFWTRIRPSRANSFTQFERSATFSVVSILCHWTTHCFEHFP